MAAVAVENHSQLPRGLKDSKLLTREQREALFERVVRLPHAVRICLPGEVDEWVFQGKLNWLEAEKTAEMILDLEGGEAIIDCPSRNLLAYRRFIEERCPNCSVRVMFKADQKYKLVAAASIIAKVTRDRLIDAIKEEYGECGSGYLTDPLTQAFMQDFDPDFPHYRKSWQPYKDRVAKMQQRTLL